MFIFRWLFKISAGLKIANKSFLEIFPNSILYTCHSFCYYINSGAYKYSWVMILADFIWQKSKTDLAYLVLVIVPSAFTETWRVIKLFPENTQFISHSLLSLGFHLLIGQFYLRFLSNQTKQNRPIYPPIKPTNPFTANSEFLFDFSFPPRRFSIALLSLFFFFF